MPRGLPRNAGALLVAAAGLCLAAVLFGGGSRYAPLAWIGAAAVLAAALGLALVLLGRLAFPRLDGAAVAFVALLAWFVLWNAVSIVWSLQPDRSWEYFNRGVVYFAFVLLGILIAAAARWAPRAIAGGLLVLFAAALCWALVGKVVPNLGPDADRTARLRSPLGYWNALALLAGMAIPLALWAAVRREHTRWIRVGSVVVVYLAAIALLLTYSRGGVVVALAGVAVYIAFAGQRLETTAALVLALAPAALLATWSFGQPGLVEAGRPYDQRLRDGLEFGAAVVIVGAAVAFVAHLGVANEGRWQPQLTRVLSPRGIAVASVVVVLVAALGLTRGDPVGWARDSFREFTNPVTTAGSGPERLGDFGSNSRWTWWGEAWQLWEDHPVAGTGAGTFSLARRPLRTNTTVATEPHNLALQFLSETGLVGFLLITGAGVAAALATVRALRRLDQPDAAAVLALAVLALVYLIHGLVDYDWDFVAVSAPVFLVLGVLVAAGRPAARVPREAPFAVGFLVLGAAVLASLAAPWLAAREVESAYAALERRDAGEAASDARRARTLNPLAVEPLFAEAVAEEVAGDDRKALDLYIRAVELQPENPRTWFELGRFELDIGLRDAGIRHLQRSSELDRWGPADPLLGTLGL
ncbi:MAG TPA: O-antigen ligase family protein [Gaiellaceae bacterium]|nr:O-antigen ligase family protein [Gaiellaceae bacterium]